MGFLDALLGRTRPPAPDLDALFRLPSAAITLAAASQYRPAGTGSVCFRAAEGRAFADIEKEIRELLTVSSGASPEVTDDAYGYTWLTCHHAPDDIEGLVTDLHAVNTSLAGGGFGPQLLCTLLAFRAGTGAGGEGGAGADGRGADGAGADGRGAPGRGGGSLGLVYLYKRGTFYPFVPKAGRRRDNAAELELRGMLGDDLTIEPDLGRWFPVWGAPGL